MFLSHINKYGSMAGKTINYCSFFIGIAVIAIGLESANGDNSEWTKCREMPTVHFIGSACPYWCTDAIIYEIACKPDGSTPISCSESRNSCPNHFRCESISCIKSPCYEPNGVYSSFMEHLELCKRYENDYVERPTKKPWDIEYSTEKPYNRSRKTDLISAVLPVMLIMIVIVTVIMVLRCFMRRRQARRFQGTSASGQERTVHNEPLISNHRYPKPNVTANPICAGAIPPQLPMPQSVGAAPQPTAPYPTLNYPHSASVNTVPYPSYSNPHNTVQYPSNPNSANASMYPSEMPELPPNYSPHSEHQQFPDTAPPTYFEAIRENQPVSNAEQKL